MAIEVNIHQAKTHFSKLLRDVQDGHEVIIAKAGKPIARLVPFQQQRARRQPGSARGQIVIHPDFDAALPEDLQQTFGSETAPSKPPLQG